MSVTGRAVSRLLRVPPRTSGYTVDRRVRVPMRDGVNLLADHYVPDTPHPAGTLLVRCPYGRGFPFSLLFAAVYAGRGYHVVVQSVRGTFGSGGDFTPMVHERQDGADTVAWLREQPWFTGTFATVGLSYLGFTQWALLTDPPPELRAAVIAVGPHDFHTSSWGTGSFSLNDFLGWSDMMAHQEDPGRLAALVRQVRAGRRVARATAGLPLGEAGRRLLGAAAPWYESWLQDPDDAMFWDRLRVGEALDRVNVPVLLFGGWQDLFLDQTLAQYRHLRERGVPVGLTVGSWTHSQVMTKGAPTVLRETLDWLDTHLGRAPESRTRPVRIEIDGVGWRELADWPPPSGERELFLQPGGRLATDPPAPTAPPSAFTYNPADPTPTIGGRLLSAKGGYRRDDRMAQRADVLTFTGDQLAADLFVVGTPYVELVTDADNPHRDLFVRLSQVDRNGHSHNVTEGFRRLNGENGTVRLDLDAVAHRFPAGSRLRVLVAGGSHPRFARNLGTGEPPVTGRGMATSVHTVRHGQGGVSRIVLPAANRPPSAD
ncbi:CocE/NonD family hydrolase [Mycobacterium sp. WMMD1722]|uniref:CocE/NonD family hydrolase n=1 Tax=Mycobacterium sp. WMMD1722 TaxID=3404117 RepID=UPI003BF4D6C5